MDGLRNNGIGFRRVREGDAVHVASDCARGRHLGGWTARGDAWFCLRVCIFISNSVS